MAGEVLFTVLRTFFSVDDHETETTLNVPEIMLMMKQSIDRNSKCTIALKREVERIANVLEKRSSDE